MACLAHAVAHQFLGNRYRIAMRPRLVAQFYTFMVRPALPSGFEYEIEEPQRSLLT